jgi:hypothetical protein
MNDRGTCTRIPWIGPSGERFEAEIFCAARDAGNEPAAGGIGAGKLDISGGDHE